MSCGSELNILMYASLADITSASTPLIAEGIRRMRQGQLQIEPGYDGEFGTVHVFAEDERQSASGFNQASLF